MDSLNERQLAFINKLKYLAALMDQVHNLSFQLKESFTEEFKSSQDNALDEAGLADDLAALGLDYSSIQAICDQALTNYVKFYTNEAVSTREYGKDVRRIMDITQ